MMQTRSRLGIFSFAAGLTSLVLMAIVAAGAARGYGQAPPAQLIAAAAMMLGSVLSGLIAVGLGVTAFFRPGRKRYALAGTLVGGGAVAFLVLLVVIGMHVGAGAPAAMRLPAPPALRPQLSP